VDGPEWLEQVRIGIYLTFTRLVLLVLPVKVITEPGVSTIEQNANHRVSIHRSDGRMVLLWQVVKMPSQLEW